MRSRPRRWTQQSRSSILLREGSQAQTLACDDRNVVVPRAERLLTRIESEPKGLSWKMRAKVREKARWYEIPDSDGDWMLD